MSPEIASTIVGIGTGHWMFWFGRVLQVVDRDHDDRTERAQEPDAEPGPETRADHAHEPGDDHDRRAERDVPLVLVELGPDLCHRGASLRSLSRRPTDRRFRRGPATGYASRQPDARGSAMQTAARRYSVHDDGTARLGRRDLRPRRRSADALGCGRPRSARPAGGRGGPRRRLRQRPRHRGPCRAPAARPRRRPGCVAVDGRRGPEAAVAVRRARRLRRRRPRPAVRRPGRDASTRSCRRRHSTGCPTTTPCS